MENKKLVMPVKVLTAFTFLLMVIVNGLANSLPLNGKLTGEVSDSYGNLFAPTGLTFIIWGFIYLFLAIYTVYQIAFYKDQEKVIKIGILFSVSSVANALWIFSWHYDQVLLSVLFMLVILICLISINNITKNEGVLVRVPFSVYFGWITVATIANITVFLVDLNVQTVLKPEYIWTIIIIVVGMIIGNVTMIRNKDIAYGIVLIWAYLGILIKHVGQNGFSGEYPSVIVTVIICMVLFLAAEVYVISSVLKKRKGS